MTYARARLLVGTSGVGTVVVLATAALVLGWPDRFLPHETGLLTTDVAWLCLVLLAHVVVLAPFDLFGGFLLPRRFVRSGISGATFAARWLRGVLSQLTVILTAAGGILAAGRFGGIVGSAAAFLAVMLLLLLLQGPFVRWVSGVVVTSRTARVAGVQSTDAAFTGGAVGLPGSETLLVPDRWHELLGEDGRAAQLARWDVAIRSGARTVGVGVALVWNLSGFLLASAVPGANVYSVAGFVTLGLGFTLWSFLGLLVLPSVSRPAVYAIDRRSLDTIPDAGVLVRTLERLDRVQDDEPVRSSSVETVFHPIPALAHRVAALSGRSAPRFGAWHAARTALFLSWAGLGLLSRAVHCNSGRPELWALPPCD